MPSIFWVFALLFLQDQAKPLPELKPFLVELRKNLRTDTELLSNYTYTVKDTVMKLDGDKKAKETTVNVFETFPGTTYRIRLRRQTVKDNKPLTAAELRKQDEELKKQSAEIQKKIDAQSPAEKAKKRADSDRNNQEILDDVFAVYEVQIISREILADRPVIFVRFTPRQAYKPKTKQGSYMQHMSGTAWIDEADHQIARIEAEVIDPISVGFGILAKLQRGAFIRSERRKFNDEVWLPVSTEVSFSARFLLLKGFNIRQLQEFSDHKKYNVDTILKFTEP